MLCGVAAKERKYGIIWERHTVLGGSCGRCEQEFRLLQPRRHCRRCGKVVCHDCLNPDWVSVPGSSKPKPVCLECFSPPSSTNTPGTSDGTSLDEGEDFLGKGGACGSDAYPADDSKLPACFVCGEPGCAGSMLQLADGRGAVHESCFVCSVDHVALTEGSFVLHEDNRLFCLDHYKAEFCQVCRGCSTHICNGVAVDALDSSWHRDCFICAMCQQPLAQLGEGSRVKFYQHNNEIYCERDYFEHVANRCAGCNFPIRKKNKIKALGKSWHEECFVCGVCHEPFAFRSQTKFRIIEGQPRCQGNCRPQNSSFSASFCVKGEPQAGSVIATRTSSNEKNWGSCLCVGHQVPEIGPTNSLASVVLPGSPPRLPRDNSTGYHLSRAIHDLIQPGVSEAQPTLCDHAYKASHQAPHCLDFEQRPSEFWFEAFAPEVFRDMRHKVFGVTEDEYLRSVCVRPLSGGSQGEGKSGQLFFKSWDDKFIAKTVDQWEVRFFHTCLKQYHSYLTNGPQLGVGNTASLLPQFLGLYSLKYPREAVLHFVIMANVFPRGVHLHERYDLKGVLSSKRFVTDEQRARGVEVLKDRNFVEDRSYLKIGSEVKERLIKQLTMDVGFLQQHGRTDYSLLIGVAHASQVRDRPSQVIANQWPTVACNGVFSADENEVFFMGIIDILQEYTMLKALEGTMKKMVHVSVHLTKESRFAVSQQNAVSAVSSEDYGKRFLQFFHQALEC